MERTELWEKLKSEGKLGELANETEQPEVHLDALLIVYYLHKLVEIGFMSFEGLEIKEDGIAIAEAAIEGGWKMGEEHMIPLLASIGIQNPRDMMIISSIISEIQEDGIEAVKAKLAGAKAAADAQMETFDESDWDHFQKMASRLIGLEIDSLDHLKMLYLQLPEEVKEVAKTKGMKDPSFEEEVTKLVNEANEE